MSCKFGNFFLNDNDCEISYKNIRDFDHPNCKKAKEFIEHLWKQFQPHLGSEKKNQFLLGAKKQLLQNFWEMYLFCSLRERKFDIKVVDSHGPDFLIHLGERRVWVEATAPSPGSGENRVLDPFKETKSTDFDTIVLRYTGAAKEKKAKYQTYLKKKVIDKDDAYVLAVNSYGFYQHTEPYVAVPNYLRGFLPMGDLIVPVNKVTKSQGKPYFSYKKAIEKANGSCVAKDSFLNNEYRFYSAVLHSSAHYLSFDNLLGFEFSVLHNPLATHRLSERDFHWCEQFCVVENQESFLIQRF